MNFVSTQHTDTHTHIDTDTPVLTGLSGEPFDDAGKVVAALDALLLTREDTWGVDERDLVQHRRWALRTLLSGYAQPQTRGKRKGGGRRRHVHTQAWGAGGMHMYVYGRMQVVSSVPKVQQADKSWHAPGAEETRCQTAAVREMACPPGQRVHCLTWQYSGSSTDEKGVQAEVLLQTMSRGHAQTQTQTDTDIDTETHDTDTQRERHDAGTHTHRDTQRERERDTHTQVLRHNRTHQG